MNTPTPSKTRMSDARFAIPVALVGCPLAVAGVILEMPLLLVLGIMLSPIACIFRGRAAGNS